MREEVPPPKFFDDAGAGFFEGCEASGTDALPTMEVDTVALTASPERILRARQAHAEVEQFYETAIMPKSAQPTEDIVDHAVRIVRVHMSGEANDAIVRRNIARVRPQLDLVRIDVARSRDADPGTDG